MNITIISGLGKEEDSLLFVPAASTNSDDITFMSDVFKMINTLARKAPVFIIVLEQTRKLYEQKG